LFFAAAEQRFYGGNTLKTGEIRKYLYTFCGLLNVPNKKEYVLLIIKIFAR